MNVLVIPSWYPTRKDPLCGSFFREQALLLGEDVSIRVLFDIERYITFKRFLCEAALDRLKHRKRLERCDELLLSPPDARGIYCVNTYRFSEQTHWRLKQCTYETALHRMIGEGWKPDVIHAHSAFFNGIVAQGLGKVFDIPTVITEHQVFLPHRVSDFMRDNIFRALEGATRVIAVSRHQQRCILAAGVKCRPLVIGNLVDEKVFRISNELRSESGDFGIVFVTDPSYIKDNGMFFRALTEIVRRGHTNVRVLIAARPFHPGQRGAVADMVREHGLDDCCEVRENVPREEMPAIYNRSDLLVSTSMAETFGTAIREAMACGKPVVSTANGGADDILSKKNGIKVDVGDYNAVAEAVISIMTGQRKFDPLEVRQSAVEACGREVFREKMLDVYEQAAIG